MAWRNSIFSASVILPSDLARLACRRLTRIVIKTISPLPMSVPPVHQLENGSADTMPQMTPAAIMPSANTMVNAEET